MDPYLRVLRACDLTVAPEIEAFHDLAGPRRYVGQARVDRGRHPMARLICKLAGYPGAGGVVPVTVTLTPTDGGAIWTREFGNHITRSTLWTSPDERVVMERLGLPVPRVLLPRGATFEYVRDGRFHFDVSGELPGIGLMIRYQGALEPEE